MTHTAPTHDNPNIVYSEQIAHVTFTIEQIDDWYLVTSETKNEGKQLIIETEDEWGAWHALTDEKEQLEKKIEHLRKGKPTPRQLYFLFDQKIPIPLTLTWGEASDIIDDRLKQIKQERTKRHANLFKDFTVGMRITQSFTFSGKKHTNKGEITKLTSNNEGIGYAHVMFDGSARTSKVAISTLTKESE